MRRILLTLAAAQARAAGHCLSEAVRYATDAVFLAWAAVAALEVDAVPVAEQPEYRVNTWTKPGEEPKA